MNNGLEIFSSDVFGNVRVFKDNLEKVWFVASDVSNTLGYARANNMYKVISDKNKKEINPHNSESVANAGLRLNVGIQIETNENIKRLVLISESGLYQAIFGSKLPSALEFQEWVTDEVLPTIRKTGSYSVAKEYNLPTTYLEALEQLVLIEKEKQVLTQKIDEQAPQIEYLHNVVNSEGSLTVTQIAKQFNMSAVSLNKILADLKVQYKVGGQWVLTADYMNMDLVETQTYLIDDEKTVQSTKWTQKGKEFIYNLLLDNNHLTPILSMIVD